MMTSKTELDRLAALERDGILHVVDDHGPGCDGPLNCTCPPPLCGWCGDGNSDDLSPIRPWRIDMRTGAPAVAGAELMVDAGDHVVEVAAHDECVDDMLASTVMDVRERLQPAHPHPDCPIGTHDHWLTRAEWLNGNDASTWPGGDDVFTIARSCSDCGQPAYYDTSDDRYHHVDPTASCFLIPADSDTGLVAAEHVMCWVRATADAPNGVRFDVEFRFSAPSAEEAEELVGLLLSECSDVVIVAEQP